MIKKDARIFITNHERMPGNALARVFKAKGFKNLILKAPSELPLADKEAVSAFFQREKLEYVFLTSIRSGGIQANIGHPAELLYENIITQANVIDCAKKAKVKRLFFIAASCVYPKDCPQPIKEEYLLTGPFEPTNESYAVAKIAGIKMCEAYNRQYATDFVSIIPSNLYGPGDDFDPETSHAIPALMKRFHEAKLSAGKSVEIWGSGIAKRDFIYADDLAGACLFLMGKKKLPDVINIGTGLGVSIRSLAEAMRSAVGFKGILKFDTARPEGMPVKVLDNRRLSSMGWEPGTDISAGLKSTYGWYMRSLDKGTAKGG